MNSFLKVGLACVFCLLAQVSRAQILTGNVIVNTPHQIALVTGYPESAVSVFVPTGTITALINGNQLAGTNLGLGDSGQTVVIGIPNLANLTVTWHYSAVQMADGSGTAVMLRITFSPTLAGSTGPTETDRVLLTPAQMKLLFLDEYDQAMARLNSANFLAYRFNTGNGYQPSPAIMAFNFNPNSPYYSWGFYDPYAGVKVGDPVYLGF